jgi:ferredoxin-NADP reductase
MGSFCLHNNTARPAVFLAGGIGIAPFISMLTYATEEKLRHRIVLFYVNRYLEDVAFIDALWKVGDCKSKVPLCSYPHARGQ